MQQATAALSTTLIDMGNFCSDMLKLWLKLHEATQNAPVRLPEYPLAYKLVVAIGRLRDVFKTTIVSVSETMSKSDKMREPLLQSPQQASMTEANGDRSEAQPSTSGPGADDAEHVVWEGTTWQGCPAACFCCSPICCSSWHWHITGQRIDLTHGCCGSSMETLDLRRIIDLHFHRSVWQLCCDRGTIVIHSDNDEFPKLELTTFGTRQLFEKLKKAWTRARIATAVHHDNSDHHMHT